MRIAHRQLRKRRFLAFNRLANDYNKAHFSAGVKNLAGERRIALDKEKKVAFLDADRVAPWRSASAIKNQIKKWGSFTKLTYDAAKKEKKKDAAGNTVEDSEDDKEIPDPHPEAVSLEETGKKRKALIEKGRKKKQAKSGSGHAVAPLVEDSGSELSDLPDFPDTLQTSNTPADIEAAHILMAMSRGGRVGGENDDKAEEGAKKDGDNDDEEDDLYNA
jgi:hypothetical protein